MKSLLGSLLLLLAAARHAAAASDKPLKPCTIVSPATERFFDLNPLRRTAPEEDKKKITDIADGFKKKAEEWQKLITDMPAKAKEIPAKFAKIAK